MQSNDNEDLLAIALCTLFAAYGKTDQEERLEVYYRALYKFNADLIHLSCQKCLYNSIYLPSIADIIKEAQSLELDMHPENKIKSWEEALSEITNAVHKSNTTQPIQWSTPEIAKAVRLYGFQNLCLSSSTSYSFAIESIHKNYINICHKLKNNLQNRAILGMEDGNLLGIPMNRQLQNHSLNKSYELSLEVLSKIKERTDQ